jgi:hypothetical protein
MRRHGPKSPFKGRVISITRLGGRNKERDVSEIIIDTGGVKFHEGQVRYRNHTSIISETVNDGV